jgi:hypothetical protein
VARCLHRAVRAGLQFQGTRDKELKGELGDPAGGCLGGVTGSGRPGHLHSLERSTWGRVGIP